MHLTEVVLQRKIEWITREIQEAKEEGLRVDMDTAIYKAATVTLDEDLASQMKIKIDVDKETEDLREKLDMLRLKVQEREARIESETTTLLAKLREMGKNTPSISEEPIVIPTTLALKRLRKTTTRKSSTNLHY